jgi:hypothetical protein
MLDSATEGVRKLADAVGETVTPGTRLGQC